MSTTFFFAISCLTEHYAEGQEAKLEGDRPEVAADHAHPVRSQLAVALILVPGAEPSSRPSSAEPCHR